MSKDHPIILSYLVEIREKPNNESTITIAETGETGYIHTIKTKYFEIEVILYGIKQHPKDLPTTIADKVEGYVVYYDTFVSFRFSIENGCVLLIYRIFQTKDYQCLKEYAELMSDKDLEFGYVICKSNKVTQHEHTEFLNNCPTFAIIELERTRVDDEDPTGFAELRDAFNNFVWSNVNCDKGIEMKWLGQNQIG